MEGVDDLVGLIDVEDLRLRPSGGRDKGPASEVTEPEER